MPNIDEAIDALLAYQQADMEGVMVLTSRQAIHEVADELRRLRAPAQPTPEPSEAEIEAWIRTIDTEKSQNILMWRQRALDAEADALRLHKEKMEMYERAITAEAKLSAHNGSSAESDLANAVMGLEYYIGNPSAWGHYDDEMSERLRPVVEAARRITAQPQGSEVW